MSPRGVEAVLAFYNYFPRIEIELAIAASSPRWATSRSIRDLLSYPFAQLQVRRAVVKVSHDNERSHSLVQRLGFVKEGVLRQANSDGGDLTLYSMLADEYTEKWVKRVNRKRHRHQNR